MPVGLLTLEIHLPYSHSLKEKRAVLRKIKDRLRSRFNVAVAEMDHRDVWQLATLGSFRFPTAGSFWIASFMMSCARQREFWEKMLPGTILSFFDCRVQVMRSLE